MNEDRLLDIIGEAKDRYLIDAEVPVKRRSWKKYMAIAASVVLVVMTSMQFILQRSTLTIPSGARSSDNNFSHEFLVDGIPYYIQADGDLYSCGIGDPAFVYAFPTNIVRWSGYYSSFFYIDDAVLYVYDMNTNQVNKRADLSSICEKNAPCYAICAAQKYVYFRCNNTNYRINVETNDIDTLSMQIHHLLYSSEDYLVYITSLSSNALESSTENSLCVLDPNTNQVITTIPDAFSPDNTIVSAAIYKDTLLYATSDGLLKCAQLYAETGKIDFFDHIEEQVIAVSSFDEQLFCVIGKRENDVCHTSLVEIRSDGTLRYVRDAETPTYSVPSTCHLSVDSESYIWGVTTNKIVSWGNLD